MSTADTQLHRPDLPELESVSVGGGSYEALIKLIWLLISIGVGFAVMLVYVAIWLPLKSLWQNIYGVLLIGSISALLFALITALFTNWFDFSCKTDSQGITVRGILRKRFISWQDMQILKVKTVKSDKGTMNVLKVTGLQIPVTRLFGIDWEILAASIWQHLRKFGKADDSYLSPGARSLWMPIPGDVPMEMDWANPKAPNWPVLLAAAIFVLFLVAIGWLLSVNGWLDKSVNSLFHMANGIIPVVYIAIRDRLMMARSVSIRADRFEAVTPRGRIDLPWSKIKNIHWDKNHSLIIGASTSAFGKVAVIPFLKNDPDSPRPMLSIIRRLRSSEQPMAIIIPEFLLTSDVITPAFANDDIVEWRRVSRFATCVAVFMNVFLIMIAIRIKSFFHNIIPEPVIPILFGILILYNLLAIWRFSKTYKADANGITIGTVFNSRLIKWHEISRYSVKRSSFNNMYTRTLLDTSGRRLLTLNIAGGYSADADRFAAYLDMKLAHVRQDEDRFIRS